MFLFLHIYMIAEQSSGQSVSEWTSYTLLWMRYVQSRFAWLSDLIYVILHLLLYWNVVWRVSARYFKFQLYWFVHLLRSGVISYKDCVAVKSCHQIIFLKNCGHMNPICHKIRRTPIYPTMSRAVRKHCLLLFVILPK